MGAGKKYARVLGFVATAINLGIYVIFAASMHSLTTSFMALMPAEGEEPFRTDASIDPSTGAVALTFSTDVRNGGLLDIKASLGLRLLSGAGEVIAEGADSELVSPGSSGELVVRMTIPREDVERYSLETAKPTLSLSLEYRTFYNLIGMGISTEVPFR
ncbi:TPA: hypothetical protein EYP44_01230 [Candidatus Bathyarchaeota archaeon]|nr:hypothetical protein [Candidatus Bathyarchaeota archaeon]